MQQAILILHVLTALCLIVLILLQNSKGADAGSAFGAGTSNTIFGSQGSGSFLVKATTILAAIFFSTSIALNYISPKQNTLDKLLSEQPVASKILPVAPESKK